MPPPVPNDRGVRRSRLARLAGAAIALVAAVHAQGEPLPPSLGGQWTVLAAGGRTFVDRWQASIDPPGAPGPVRGRFSWRAPNCGALDEPLEGSWDGRELVFTTTLRPNVNTANKDRDCGDGRLAVKLRRKPGDRSFEGEASFRDVTATLAGAP